MPNKYYPTDARLEHRAVAQAAVTASAVIDTIDQRAAMRTDFTTIVGVEAIKIQHEIEWNTEVNGVVYDKARLNLIIAGTSPTITFHARSTIR